MRPAQLLTFLYDEQGVTSIEYGLIATVVSVGIIAAVTYFTNSLNNLWFTVASNVTASL